MVQDVTSNTSSVEFIAFPKTMINSKLGYFSFSNFPTSPFSFAHIALHQTKLNIRKTVGLCYEPCPRVSEHAFLKKPDQPKEANLNFDFVFFFTACCSYYHKIRLASLKPQLPTHNDNLKFCVVIIIRTQLQNY